MLKCFKLLLSSLTLVYANSVAAKTHHQLLSDTTVSIRIQGRMHINPTPLFIDILEKDGQLNIVYTVISNINFIDMVPDTAYQNAYKRYKQGKTTVLPWMSFYKKYGSSATEIISTTDKDLIDLLAQLHASTVEDIVRNEANKDRHLMDGADFYLVEIASTGTRQIQIDAPDEESHPLLYHIMAKCADIYKSKYPDKTF